VRVKRVRQGLQTLVQGTHDRHDAQHNGVSLAAPQIGTFCGGWWSLSNLRFVEEDGTLVEGLSRPKCL